MVYLLFEWYLKPVKHYSCLAQCISPIIVMHSFSIGLRQETDEFKSLFSPKLTRYHGASESQKYKQNKTYITQSHTRKVF